MKCSFRVSTDGQQRFYQLEEGDCFLFFRGNDDPLIAIKIEETENGCNALDLEGNRVIRFNDCDYVKLVDAHIVITEG